MTWTIIITFLSTVYVLIAISQILNSIRFHIVGELWMDIIAAILWPIRSFVYLPIRWLSKKLMLRKIYTIVKVLVFNIKIKTSDEWMNYKWRNIENRDGFIYSLERKAYLRVAKQNNITLRASNYVDDK